MTDDEKIELAAERFADIADELDGPVVDFDTRPITEIIATLRRAPVSRPPRDIGAAEQRVAAQVASAAAVLLLPVAS